MCGVGAKGRESYMREDKKQERWWSFPKLYRGDLVKDPILGKLPSQLGTTPSVDTAIPNEMTTSVDLNLQIETTTHVASSSAKENPIQLPIELPLEASKAEDPSSLFTSITKAETHLPPDPPVFHNDVFVSELSDVDKHSLFRVPYQTYSALMGNFPYPLSKLSFMSEILNTPLFGEVFDQASLESTLKKNTTTTPISASSLMGKSFNSSLKKEIEKAANITPPPDIHEDSLKKIQTEFTDIFKKLNSFPTSKGTIVFGPNIQNISKPLPVLPARTSPKKPIFVKIFPTLNQFLTQCFLDEITRLPLKLDFWNLASFFSFGHDLGKEILSVWSFENERRGKTSLYSCTANLYSPFEVACYFLNKRYSIPQSSLGEATLTIPVLENRGPEDLPWRFFFNGEVKRVEWNGKVLSFSLGYLLEGQTALYALAKGYKPEFVEEDLQILQNSLYT